MKEDSIKHYNIFCDETWSNNVTGRKSYFVIYGIILEKTEIPRYIDRVKDFRKRRGLNDEVKWERVQKEWKNAIEYSRKNRYEDYLDIFFDFLNHKKIGFGCMFLEVSEYERGVDYFKREQPDNKSNCLFMLYYNFLYHCFIKNKVNANFASVFIDNRNTGPVGAEYNLNKLQEILHKKQYLDAVPKGQLLLSDEMKRSFSKSIKEVKLAESKENEFIQLADLCGGCFRHILENNISPSPPALDMFSDTSAPASGQDALSIYFYDRLRQIEGYKDIKLNGRESYHHHFNLFPFRFPREN